MLRGSCRLGLRRQPPADAPQRVRPSLSPRADHPAQASGLSTRARFERPCVGRLRTFARNLCKYLNCLGDTGTVPRDERTVDQMDPTRPVRPAHLEGPRAPGRVGLGEAVGLVGQQDDLRIRRGHHVVEGHDRVAPGRARCALARRRSPAGVAAPAAKTFTPPHTVDHVVDVGVARRSTSTDPARSDRRPAADDSAGTSRHRRPAASLDRLEARA